MPYKINTIYVLKDNRAVHKTQYFMDDQNRNLYKIMWTMDEYWINQEGKSLDINLKLEDVVLGTNLPEPLYWEHP